MLDQILYKNSSRRFITYTAILYVLALTLPSLFLDMPQIAPVMKFMPVVLMPLAQIFVVTGSVKRWPSKTFLIIAITTGFWAGISYQIFSAS